MGSSPNFRGASALLRGSSRAFSPDCEPQRAFRGQPPQAALRPRSRHPPRRPCGLPCGRGATGRMLFWVPDQNNALRFSGFQPEARLRATLGQDAPHGLGVSDPSPCAPPRQAGRLGPVGHSVVGFCGTARVEWAGPVWAKNRSGRAVTCVSLPPSQRRAPFRGFHKGDTPLCALLVPFRASEKGPAARGRTPRIPVPLAAHFSKKVRCCTAAQKESPRGGGLPASPAAGRRHPYLELDLNR